MKSKFNQYLKVDNLILEVKSETKTKPARITIAVPQELVDKLFQCFSNIEKCKIANLYLCWKDLDIKKDKYEKEHN